MAPTSDVSAGGEVTFTVGGRLYAAGREGSNARCLYQLTASEAGPIGWGPHADRVLLGPANVAVGVSVNPSGFFATNGDVKWSLPEGTRTFAATFDGKLKKRGLRDAAPEEISFLKFHESSVYHPAGRAVVSVGTAIDGTYGLFLADNNGLGARPIAIGETARKLTEPVWDSRGDNLFFIAEHPGAPATWHVHSLSFPSLGLGVLYETTQPLSDLVASTDAQGGVAVREGGCDPSGATEILRSGNLDALSIGDAVPVFANMATKPVGFLDPSTLVIEAFPKGCARPSDLWVVSLSGPTGPNGLTRVASWLLVSGVDQAAVRVVRGPFDELPTNINPQAPG